MRLIWLREITGALCMIALSLCPGIALADEGPVHLTLRPVPDKAGQVDLQISIQNNGTTPWKLYTANLPWANSRSMYLTAVRNRTVLNAPIPIDDPIAGETEMKPGEKLEGTINMHGRFPDLDKELKTSDVDLLWTYQLVTTDGKVVQRLGGWLPLPKRVAPAK
jgi:hypothetical protein